MLAADRIRRRFAGLVALDGASMSVEAGEIVGLVGPNGSGKSTLLNVLSGFLRPDAGSVVFEERRIEGNRPWKVARLGLRRTFQLAAQPKRLTTLEVMLTGARLQYGGSAYQSLLRPSRVAAEQDEAVADARALLEKLTLLPLEHHPAGLLSGGQQKLLALGAALMGNPKMLLLDEPTAGVNPTLRQSLTEQLLGLRQVGTTLLVVEHDMGVIRDLCDRVYVLDKGSVIACCTPRELSRNKRVVEAYLGSSRGKPLPASR